MTEFNASRTYMKVALIFYGIAMIILIPSLFEKNQGCWESELILYAIFK